MNLDDLQRNSPVMPPLRFDHFPARHQAVIWRNWNLVAPGRLAQVLGTTVENIETAAAEMGLTRDDRDLEAWRAHGHLTIIRRNWELLTFQQLLELLGWTAGKMMFVLREEDYMYYKMGLLKPCCQPAAYRPLDAAERRRTAEIRELIEKEFGSLPARTAFPFDFKENYGHVSAIPGKSAFDLRMIYSYSARFDSPLEVERDWLPDALLADYAASGVNAVWFSVLLYTLVPWLGEDEKYSAGWQTRLNNLNKSITRAARYGIKVYLYLKEPRAMPEEFFLRHPSYRGTHNAANGYISICLTEPEIPAALSNGVERLCRAVPELGGFFLISHGESTNCLSLSRTEAPSPCPRCAAAGAPAIIAAAVSAIARGAARANPALRVLAWNWAWQPQWMEEIIRQLPSNITLMATSETGLETELAGRKGVVSDYSISKIGPGPVAKYFWKLARERGFKIAAKVQVNNSWEMACVPYIPVPGLIERHLENLKTEGITDLMLSWTLGGYPGGNLDLLHCSREELARRRYGISATPAILEAWMCFENAFEKMPFHYAHVLYYAPQNFGPMNLLWAKPTGRTATMVGFPYDDLATWRGPLFPEEIFEEAFRQISEGWFAGLKILKAAGNGLAGTELANWRDLCNVAVAAYCHFRSTYLQICFVRRRASNDCADILNEEIALAKELDQVMQRDSRIGFEASNHYFYTTNDLREKVLNCEWLKKLYTRDARG